MWVFLFICGNDEWHSSYNACVTWDYHLGSCVFLLASIVVAIRVSRWLVREWTYMALLFHCLIDWCIYTRYELHFYDRRFSIEFLELLIFTTSFFTTLYNLVHNLIIWLPLLFRVLSLVFSRLSYDCLRDFRFRRASITCIISRPCSRRAGRALYTRTPQVVFWWKGRD